MRTRVLWLGLGCAFALAVVATAQNTVNLLNTSYNAESTGNVLTLPFKDYLSAGVCDAGGYSTRWSTGVAHANVTDPCVEGTNVTFSEIEFAETGVGIIWTHWLLPSDWTSTIDFVIVWTTPATSGNVAWQVQTACSAVGETIDPAWNTAQTITDAAQGTTTRLNTASLSSVTTTGCAAGELLFVKVARDPAHANDTISAVADFIGAELTYRRAI